MRYIIDRLLETLALCEDEEKRIIEIPREKLPRQLREGDILREEGGIFTADPQASGERRKAMRKKLTDLFE